MGLGALVIFETARLLRKYPEFNAIHDRGADGQYADVNIGWAIDAGTAGGGLMVPVIAKADEKTPQEIVEIMQRQIDGYVGSALGTADFLGGTFTISDLSGDGISHFQPLISQGQAAILGVGGELDGAGNETLYLTLAFDHQLAEGPQGGAVCARAGGAAGGPCGAGAGSGAGGAGAGRAVLRTVPAGWGGRCGRFAGCW